MMTLSPSKKDISINNSNHSLSRNHDSINTSRRGTLDDSFNTTYDTSILSEDDDTELEDILGRSQRIRGNDENDLSEYKYDLKEMKQCVGRLSNHGLLQQFNSSDYDSRRTSSGNSTESERSEILSVVTTLRNIQQQGDNDHILDTLMVMEDEEDSSTAIMASEAFNNIKLTIRDKSSVSNTPSRINTLKQGSPSKSSLKIQETELKGYEGDNEVLRSMELDNKNYKSTETSIDNFKSMDLESKWEIEKKNRDLERRIANLEQELISWQQKEKIAKDSYNNEKSLTEQLKYQNDDLISENKKLVAQKKDLKDRIDSLTETNQTLTQQYDMLSSENRKLMDSLRTIEDEANRSKDQIKSSNDQISQQALTISSLEKSKEELTSKITELENTIAKQTKEIQTKSKQIRHQEKDLLNFVKEFDQTKQQFSTFIEKYEKMIEKLEKYKKLKHKLVEKISLLTKEVDRLKDENKSLNMDELPTATGKRSSSGRGETKESSSCVESRYHTPSSSTQQTSKRSSSVGRQSTRSSPTTNLNSATPNVITNMSNMSSPQTMPSSNKKSPALSHSSSSSVKTPKQPVKEPSLKDGSTQAVFETDEETDGEPLSHSQGVPFFKNPTYLRKKLITERKRVELKNFEIAGLKELLATAIKTSHTNKNENQ